MTSVRNLEASEQVLMADRSRFLWVGGYVDIPSSAMRPRSPANRNQRTKLDKSVSLTDDKNPGRGCLTVIVAANSLVESGELPWCQVSGASVSYVGNLLGI
jgi:hypothetical protein